MFLSHFLSGSSFYCWLQFLGRKPLQVLHLEHHLWRHLAPGSQATSPPFIHYSSSLIVQYISYNNLSSCGELQGILINGQFPGPQIEAVINDNVVINIVHNSLQEPFLISWSLFCSLPPYVVCSFISSVFFFFFFCSLYFFFLLKRSKSFRLKR